MGCRRFRLSERIYHVFVSSTFVDLKETRREVSAGLAKAGHVVEGMEIFPASSRSQMDFIKTVIDRCDIYVVIVGNRYGSIDPKSGKSYTELEHDYAVANGLVTLSFVAAEDADIPEGDTSSDPEKQTKLEAFKDKLKAQLADIWTKRSDVSTSVVAAVAREINMKKPAGWMRATEFTGSEIATQLATVVQANEKLKAELASYQRPQNDPIDIERFLRSAAPKPTANNFSFFFNSQAAWTWSSLLVHCGTALRLGGSSYEIAESFESRVNVNNYHSGNPDVQYMDTVLMVLENKGLVKTEVAKLQHGEQYLFHALSPVGVDALLTAATLEV